MKKALFIILTSSLLISSVWLSFNETKCDDEAFDGEAREVVKLSIGTGKAEVMTVTEFLSSFSGTPELVMIVRAVQSNKKMRLLQILNKKGQ